MKVIVIGGPALPTKEKPPVCPICGYRNDRYNAMEEGSKPKHNDISVCLLCASVNKFVGEPGNLTIVAIPDQELQAIGKQHPKFFKELMELVKGVKTKFYIKL